MQTVGSFGDAGVMLKEMLRETLKKGSFPKGFAERLAEA